MNNINMIGNSEFVDCFRVLRCIKNEDFEVELTSNPMLSQYIKTFATCDIKYALGANIIKLKDKIDTLFSEWIVSGLMGRNLSLILYIEKVKQSEYFKMIYSMFLKEAIRRGYDESWENLFGSELVIQMMDWYLYMDRNPTYIREIYNTNYLGGQNLFGEFSYLLLDAPVREACRELNKKGYKTYWSSANVADIESRNCHAVKNKNVAYILIDPDNLTDELKEQLLMDGDCSFWGIAEAHKLDNKYYGIWEEIKSKDELCLDISDKLLIKAKQLPSLIVNQGDASAAKTI